MKTIKRFWIVYTFYAILAVVAILLEDYGSVLWLLALGISATQGFKTIIELDKVKKHHAIEQDISENRAQTINDLRGTIDRMQSKKPICVIGSDRDLKDFVREQQWARCNEKIKEGTFYLVNSDSYPDKVMGIEFSGVIYVGGMGISNRTLTLFEIAQRRVR